MAAHEEQQVAFPASDRGVRVDCQLMFLQAPGLQYEYNWAQAQREELEHDRMAEAANTP